MLECRECGARAPGGKSLIHNARCSNGTLTPAEVREERRTRAIERIATAFERHADAVQHAATSVADFAMALNTFGPVLKMIAAEAEADMKKRGRKPFA